MRPILLASLLATAACATSADQRPAPAEFALRPGDSLATLTRPAAFTGDLPCADCEAITTTLLLHPNGSYRRLDQYRGGRVEGDGRFVVVGRWHLTNGRLVLDGPEPQRPSFSLTSEQQLDALDLEGNPIVSSLLRTLRRTAAPATLDGTLRLTGDFRYYADAATFVDCASGLQLPVAGNEAFIALQGRYREARLAPAAPLRLAITARLALRPAMEGDGTEEALVLESADPATGGATCQVSALHDALVARTWTLIQLDGAPVAGNAQPITLRYTREESAGQLAGSTGCNRYTGRAVLRGADLIAAPLAMTRRACVDSAAAAEEGRFAQVLSEGGWLGLRGDTLTLAQGGAIKLRFTAQP